MIKNYFKTAWRNILHHRKTTIINLSGLVIGMTAAFFVFLWVKNEYAYNRYHPDADHIYRLKTYLTIDKSNTWVWEGTPYLLGEATKKQLPEVTQVTRIRAMRFDTPTIHRDGQQIKEKNAAQVDEHWFDVFHYDFIAGSAAAFNSQVHSVILSESNAKRYFGSEPALGKILRIDTVDYLVQGVVKDSPTNSSFRYQMYLSVATRQANPESRRNDEQWGNFGYLTFVKLSTNADPVKVAGKIQDILTSNRDRGNAEIGLIGLKDIHFEDDLQSSSLLHGNRNSAKAFLWLGGVLLVIACINYVNLTTARASLRLKEVGIKKIVGAGKTQLFMQFIVESVLVSLLAIFLAILLIRLGLPYFNQLVDNHFTFSNTNRTLWQLLGGMLLVSTVLTGIYPALLLSSLKPIGVFRDKRVLGVNDLLLRKSLVIVQFTISMVLIIGTVIISRQMQYIHTQNSNYDRAQVMTLNIPWQSWSEDHKAGRKDVRDVIRQKLSAESSIERISVVNGGSVVNMENNASGGFDWNGRAEGFDPPITPFMVDTNFMALVNLQLVEGRWFTPHSKADERNVALNETAVRELGIQQPVIGQRFVNRGDTGIVIGVVKDFFYKSMHEPIGSVVLSTDHGYSSTFLVKTAAGRHGEAQQAAERIWKELLPNFPFEYQFANQEFDMLYHADRKAASLIMVFSALAIFISCLGLYGLATFNAERRHKEIGIRKVLGASVSGILLLLSKDFVKLVLIAVVIASPVAWWAMNKWLEDFAYRIDIQWWMFAGAGLMAVAIALLTVSWQAIRAAVANPVDSLRDE